MARGGCGLAWRHGGQRSRSLSSARRPIKLRQQQRQQQQQQQQSGGSVPLHISMSQQRQLWHEWQLGALARQAFKAPLATSSCSPPRRPVAHMHLPPGWHPAGAPASATMLACGPCSPCRRPAPRPTSICPQEFKGYVFKIMGGQDKQGFPMKQGVLTNGRVQVRQMKGLWVKGGTECVADQRPRAGAAHAGGWDAGLRNEVLCVRRVGGLRRC